MILTIEGDDAEKLIRNIHEYIVPDDDPFYRQHESFEVGIARLRAIQRTLCILLEQAGYDIKDEWWYEDGDDNPFL